jgi:hypothetical protein
MARAIAGQTDLDGNEVELYDIDDDAQRCETYRVRNRSDSDGDALVRVYGLHGDQFARLPPGESELFRVVGGITKVTAKADTTATVDHYPVVIL